MNNIALPSFPSLRQQRLLTRVIVVAMVLLLLFNLIALGSLQRAEALDPLTIGGLIVFGKLALDKIDSIAQNAINNAGQQVRDSLEELRAQIANVIDELQKAYQDNLSITIDSLDSFTTGKLIQFQNMVEAVNQKLQEDINLIQQATKDVINTAATQVRQLGAEIQQRLQNVVVVTAEAAVFVIDRTLFNVVLVISLILLGLGLLIFIWLIFSRKLPDGIMRPVVLLMMVAFLVVFGMLALVPRVRAQVMSAAGLGLEKELKRVTEPVPEVVGVEPRLITLGVTPSIRMIGINLRPDGKTVTATIGGISVPVVAADREAVLTVGGLSLNVGNQEAILLYDGVEAARTRQLVEVKQQVTPPPPPDLVITSFTISPSSPTAKAVTTATIVIRNQGGSAAGSFTVRWRPITSPATDVRITINGLAVGASQTLNFTHSYVTSGTVSSIATVDEFNTVNESNEGNNERTISGIVVKPEPPKTYTITVRFTSIKVISDADPFGSNEMWLDFNVGGRIGRHPNSGTFDANDGDTFSLNEVFTFTVQETDRVTITVIGTDEDNPPIDNHDDMGTVSLSFTKGDNFGSGSYSRRSTCPDGCYQINFTISVVQN
ncbi:MAG: hypothetical protein KF726_03760 [Anaerolineae bacterium]|nr:hypothetical protein [Anaerolineae bacterium]